MELTVAGQDYVIRGKTAKKMSYGSMQSLQKMWANEVEAFFMQIVNNVEPEGKTMVTTSHAAELNQLLAKYESVFQVPMTLPPVRSQDHRITLELGVGPVNVRPYRYHTSKRTRLSELLRRCYPPELLDQASVHSHHRSCLSKKKMAHSGFLWTIVH